jgi:hypothetical protein
MLLNGAAALLGVAGSVTATAVGGWIALVLICASVLLIGRSFYVIYVRGIRTRLTVAITWCALVFIAGFWTWHLTWGSRADEPDKRPLPEPVAASPAARRQITIHVPGMIDRQGIT